MWKKERKKSWRRKVRWKKKGENKETVIGKERKKERKKSWRRKVRWKKKRGKQRNGNCERKKERNCDGEK